MQFTCLPETHFEPLCALLDAYKAEIGEPCMTTEQAQSLHKAIKENRIRFFAAMDGQTAVAICSISLYFSTWQCAPAGIFEDFYIQPAYRRKGIARGLTQYVFDQCAQEGVSSLWVGASDGLKPLYESLGFTLPLGHLLCKPLAP